MRLAPRDVRDLIVSQKNDHGPSYWRYGALQRWSCLKYYFREIFGVVRFSTFATKSARNGHCGAAAGCPLSEVKLKHLLGTSISHFYPLQTKAASRYGSRETAERQAPRSATAV